MMFLFKDLPDNNLILPALDFKQPNRRNQSIEFGKSVISRIKIVHSLADVTPNDRQRPQPVSSESASMVERTRFNNLVSQRSSFKRSDETNHPPTRR